MPLYLLQHDTPIGSLILGDYGERLCMADWSHSPRQILNRRRVLNQLGRPEVVKEHPTPLLEHVADMIDLYFKGEYIDFSAVPLLLCGTPFQKDVWNALCSVKYGATLSYGQLAELAGYRLAVRAVATACGANCINIIVPCHRIVGHRGHLTGYTGGVMLKHRMLELEHAALI